MKKTILVVDDENLMIDMLKKILDSKEVEVVGVNDGEAALQYAQTNDVDLVITDIMMPKLLGTKLFFELKKIDPFLQVIIITGYPTLQNIVEMLEAGASDFILKPFDINKLRSIVNDTFTRIERWRSLRNQWLNYKKNIK
jgi:DNA-binding NtrC family response regulator